MALHIDNPEADRLAKALATATGEDTVCAVVTALRERLERVTPTRRNRDGLADKLNEIAMRFAALPTIDNRSEDDILGYGPDGLPH
ncbi:MAG: type II toxin-antitoxin system VapB family antitoxin [Acidobacteriaceae bacterium]